jgi:choline kinase
MRAIILSAGQGRRLLPLTQDSPKCMLEVQHGVSVLEFQLRVLAACGVKHASVIVGFNADQVEDRLTRRPVAGIAARTVYNPFYRLSDNLATAWLARSEMESEFILLNGDTLFAPKALALLLASPTAPLTLAINQKDQYDDDDMKVSLGDDGRLLAVGKTLSPETVHGESIGMMLFRGDGPRVFRRALEAAIREPEALGLWYLSVVNGLIDSLDIRTTRINGLWWAEIDSPEDLALVRETLAKPDARTGVTSGTPRHAG